MRRPVKISAIAKKNDEESRVYLHLYKGEGYPTMSLDFDLGLWSRLCAGKLVDGDLWDNEG